MPTTVERSLIPKRLLPIIGEQSRQNRCAVDLVLDMMLIFFPFITSPNDSSFSQNVYVPFSKGFRSHVSTLRYSPNHKKITTGLTMLVFVVSPVLGSLFRIRLGPSEEARLPARPGGAQAPAGHGQTRVLQAAHRFLQRRSFEARGLTNIPRNNFIKSSPLSDEQNPRSVCLLVSLDDE